MTIKTIFLLIIFI